MRTLGVLYKRAKLFYKLNRAKSKKQYKPVVALLFLTSRCNLACPYCFAEHRGEFPDLSVDEWKNIIDELKRRGTELIFLMGGEPLLYKGLEELIDYVKARGLQCHLTTNGVLIPEHLKDLRKVDLVMVSLDGDKRGNDLNRGAGSFEKVVRGIECAKQAGIPIRINAVMTKNNVEDVDWLLSYGERVGAYVGFTIPARSKNEKDIEDIRLTDNEIFGLHTKLLKLRKQGRKITLSARSLGHVIGYPKPYDQIILKDDPLSTGYPECCYGRYVVFVDARGFVYPCTTLWEMPEIFEPKNVFDGWDAALEHARNLPCHVCYCAGGIEWNHMSSLQGVFHALKFTFSHLRLRGD